MKNLFRANAHKITSLFVASVLLVCPLGNQSVAAAQSKANDLDTLIKNAANYTVTNIMSDGKVDTSEYKYCLQVLQSGVAGSKVDSMKKAVIDSVETELATNTKINGSYGFSSTYQLYAISLLEKLGYDAANMTVNGTKYNMAKDYSDYMTTNQINMSYSYGLASELIELKNVENKVPDAKRIENDIISFIINETGDYSLASSEDTDTISMLLVSIADYANTNNDKNKINNAVNRLIKKANSDGTYSSSWSGVNASSTALSVYAASVYGLKNIVYGDNIYSSSLNAMLKFVNTDGGFIANASTKVSDTFSTYDGLNALMAAEKLAKNPSIVKVTFCPNNDTDNSVEFALSGSVILAQKTPVRKGYTFLGWYSNTTKFNTKNPVTSDNVVTAKWRLNKYTVQYYLNGGKNTFGNPKSFTVESDKINFVKPTRTGYTFAGWYTDKKLTKKITAISAGTAKNITVYAKWTKTQPAKATVTYAKNVSAKKITVKTKAISGASYLYQIATNSKFTSSVKNAKLTKNTYTYTSLKKGTIYYVRVRAYKKDSTGVNRYGKWSSVSKIKVTK